MDIIDGQLISLAISTVPPDKSFHMVALVVQATGFAVARQSIWTGLVMVEVSSGLKGPILVDAVLQLGTIDFGAGSALNIDATLLAPSVEPIHRRHC